MSQDIFTDIVPTTTTGLMLAGLLDDFKEVMVSGFSGTSRPANLQASGMWIDTSQQAAPNYYWTLKIYNGVTDIEIFRISVLSSSSGFTIASDNFTIRRISADTTGAILNLVKNRIADLGQVLSGDTVAELRLTGRTDTATDPIVAYLRATASEDQTSSDNGVTLSIVSTPVGTSQLTEHIKFLDAIFEFVAPHKLNSYILTADAVATASSILMSSDKILSELTGSTVSTIHGIEVTAGETQVKYIHNRSTANATIKHQSLTASATERFSLPESRDILLLPECSAIFYYCTTDTRWKYISGAVAGVRGFIYNFVSGYSEWVAPVTGNVRVTAFQEPTEEATGTTAASAFTRGASKTILAWGENQYGQLGTGDTVDKSFPTLFVASGIFFKDIMIADDSSVGLTMDSVPYAWGRNNHGQLGVDDVVNRSSPEVISGGRNFSRVQLGESSYGTLLSGDVFAWGRNQHGQLGVGDVASRSSPVAVAGSLKFSAIFHGENGNTSVFGVQRDTGLLFSWGENASGELGLGDVNPRSSPVAVVGGLKFRKVVLGLGSTIGLTESGVAYGWGSNTDGELGTGNVTTISSPVAVAGGLIFKDIFALPGANNSFFGLTEDNILYAWGNNTDGELGVGDVVPRSSPVAVAGGLVFERVARLNTGTKSVIAIEESTGAAYAWGINTAGQLGVGDTTPRSTPVAVSGGLEFCSISIGANFAYGQASDGRIYAWGENASGQIGDGTTVDKSVPTAVLGLSLTTFEPPTTKVIPVTAGQTYKIQLCGGASLFGNTYIGRNIRRATVAFEA